MNCPPPKAKVVGWAFLKVFIASSTIPFLLFGGGSGGTFLLTELSENTDLKKIGDFSNTTAYTLIKPPRGALSRIASVAGQAPRGILPSKPLPASTGAVPTVSPISSEWCSSNELLTALTPRGVREAPFLLVPKYSNEVAVWKEAFEYVLFFVRECIDKFGSSAVIPRGGLRIGSYGSS